jgi:hypothetical protein
VEAKAILQHVLPAEEPVFLLLFFATVKREGVYTVAHKQAPPPTQEEHAEVGERVDNTKRLKKKKPLKEAI